MTAPTSDAVEHWERVAATRWGRYISAEEEAQVLRAAAEAPPPRHALDIGCGGGRWTRLLLDRGWTTTSLDVDPRAVAATAARNPGADCRLVRPDARELPSDDGSASLLVCIEVEPVVSAEWFPAEAGRVLVRGGRLVTVVWNRASLRGWATDTASRLRGRGPHPFYQHTYRTWRRRLLDSGFRLETERGLCWFPFGRASDSPLVPVGVAIERGLGLGSATSLSPWVVVTATRI